jgi:Trk K+ transport system NAD-binding subunit
MAKGTVAQIIGLAAITLLVMVVLGTVTYIFQLNPKHASGGQTLWDSFWGVLRATTPKWNPKAPGWMVIKVLMLLSGMFIVSMLISILTSGFRILVTALREGHSNVPFDDHTLIIGWSPSLMSVLPELILANESEHKAHVVVLSEQSKQMMDDEIRSRILDWKTTTIVTRSGDPFNPTDLDVVNIDGASSIIVLTPEGSTNPDIEVIKTLMAIASNPDRQTRPYHVVASIRDHKNVEVARIASKGEAELIPSIEVISKITAQTCRQPGLPVVYTEIMSFEDNELYITDADSLVGTSFGDAMFAYSKSCPIGVWSAQDELMINPDAAYTIAPGDRLIILAEDDSTIVRDDPVIKIEESAISSGTVEALQAERTVVLGWNSGAAIIVRELDQYIEDGSELIVVVENEEDYELAMAVGNSLEKQAFDCRVGELTDRDLLNTLGIPGAHHVILLKYDKLPAETSDSNVLVSLLHVRDIIEKSGKDIAVVTELALERNRQIAQADRADDFVVGDFLIGLLYAQIAQQMELNRVFSNLLSEDGSEIYLKPASVYVALDRPVTFATIVESAKRKKEVAIGYRHWSKKGDKEQNYGIKLNPAKADLITLGANDLVVVVAEDYFGE